MLAMPEGDADSWVRGCGLGDRVVPPMLTRATHYEEVSARTCGCQRDSSNLLRSEQRALHTGERGQGRCGGTRESVHRARCYGIEQVFATARGSRRQGSGVCQEFANQYQATAATIPKKAAALKALLATP